MFIKKYSGNNLDEIQQKILNELGPFAVVLFDIEESKGFWKSLFRRYKYEVTAAIEPEELERHLKKIKGMKSSAFEITEEKDRLHLKEEKGLEAPAFSWHYEKEEMPKIVVTGPFKFDPKQQNIILVVGPNGVYKSATVAKLAIKWQNEGPCSVAIASMGPEDCESVQQLQGFADVFNFFHRNIEKKEDLKKFSEEAGKCQILIIHTQDDGIQEIQQFVEEVPYRTLLILSAALKAEERMRLIKKYKQFLSLSLIFTRFEENPSLLFIEELMENEKIPISYLLEGSEIKTADAQDIERRILNEKLRTISTTW